jgi:hypothetical protein
MFSKINSHEEEQVDKRENKKEKNNSNGDPIGELEIDELILRADIFIMNFQENVTIPLLKKGTI